MSSSEPCYHRPTPIRRSIFLCCLHFHRRPPRDKGLKHRHMRRTLVLFASFGLRYSMRFPTRVLCPPKSLSNHTNIVCSHIAYSNTPSFPSSLQLCLHIPHMLPQLMEQTVSFLPPSPFPAAQRGATLKPFPRPK